MEGEPPEIEPFEQVEGQERGEPLGGRRRLVHGESPVVDRQRLPPFARVSGKVLRRHEALSVEPRGDCLGDCPPVKEVRPFLAERREGAG